MEKISTLTAREKEILTFENHLWTSLREKEDRIKNKFNLTPLEYYIALYSLLKKPQALQFDPILVKRLLKLI